MRGRKAHRILTESILFSVESKTRHILSEEGSWLFDGCLMVAGRWKSERENPIDTGVVPVIVKRSEFIQRRVRYYEDEVLTVLPALLLVIFDRREETREAVIVREREDLASRLRGGGEFVQKISRGTILNPLFCL